MDGIYDSKLEYIDNKVFVESNTDIINTEIISVELDNTDNTDNIDNTFNDDITDYGYIDNIVLKDVVDTEVNDNINSESIERILRKHKHEFFTNVINVNNKNMERIKYEKWINENITDLYNAFTNISDKLDSIRSILLTNKRKITLNEFSKFCYACCK